MTPGDIAMMLTETNGLRVQVTSPSTGAANVRVQGLRGRYTQILSDGLPLYGQAGSLNVLQIPPMDLARSRSSRAWRPHSTASAALGGVINLVSRRPKADQREREVLFNRTSEGGTDGALWLSDKLDRVGLYVAGRRALPAGPGRQRRWVVRRPLVSTGAGAAAGLLGRRDRPFRVHDRRRDVRGPRRGTIEGARAPDGSPFPQTLNTAAIDAGVVGRFPTGPSRVFTFRSSGLVTSHDQRFGESRERDRHHTWFGETALTGAASRHTWVVGGAFQQDGYARKSSRRSITATWCRRFSCRTITRRAPGCLLRPADGWISTTSSGRSSARGSRCSCGRRLAGRPSVGRHGFLSADAVSRRDRRRRPVAPHAARRPRGRARPQRVVRRELEARIIGADRTLFRSRIDHALQLREDADAAGKPLSIVNANGPGNTRAPS